MVKQGKSLLDSFKDGMMDVQEVVPLSVKYLAEWVELLERLSEFTESEWASGTGWPIWWISQLTDIKDKSQELLRRMAEEPNIVQLYACRGED